MALAADPGPNTIGRTLGLLGDEWSLQIVRYALAGARRFGDWKRQLGIADAVLSGRLATLVDAGVLRREVPADGGHATYRLAPSGLDLWSVLVAIWAWELHHVAGQADRLPSMVHATCGLEFEPVLRCGDCHGPAAVGDVDVALGPSGAFARATPVGARRRRTGAAGDPERGGMFGETMALVGSRWSSALLGAAFLGATRFGEFAAMTGCPPATLSDRLRSFVELGVLEASGPAGGAERRSYRLTAKGDAFFPVVAAALAWGQRWFPDPDGPAVVATHRVCGRAFVPELACSRCDEVLTGRDVVVVPGDLEP